MIIRLLHRFTAAFFAVLALCATAPQAMAQDPGFLTFGAGAFDFHRNDAAAQFELQYRPELKLWIFNPMIGASGTTDGALYGYAGLSVDVFFGNRFVLRPSVAAGAYHRGNGRDLGGVLEFRSGAELAYRFDDRSRLGVEISHRSNASIYNKNPGEETLMLFYHLPVSKLF